MALLLRAHIPASPIREGHAWKASGQRTIFFKLRGDDRITNDPEIRLGHQPGLGLLDRVGT